MDRELIEKIEKALGYKLYIATIRYIETEDAYMWSGRCCGKTTAYILWFTKEFMRVRDLLIAEGIEVVKIV